MHGTQPAQTYGPISDVTTSTNSWGAGTIYDHSDHVARIAAGMFEQYAATTGTTEPLKARTIYQSKPGAGPISAKADWKAELADLKEAFQGGLIPKPIYHAEVSKVMAAR